MLSFNEKVVMICVPLERPYRDAEAQGGLPWRQPPLFVLCHLPCGWFCWTKNQPTQQESILMRQAPKTNRITETVIPGSLDGGHCLVRGTGKAQLWPLATAAELPQW